MNYRHFYQDSGGNSVMLLIMKELVFVCEYYLNPFKFLKDCDYRKNGVLNVSGLERLENGALGEI